MAISDLAALLCRRESDDFLFVSASVDFAVFCLFSPRFLARFLASAACSLRFLFLSLSRRSSSACSL